MEKKNIIGIIVVVVIVLVAVVSLVYYGLLYSKKYLTIYHAGSLTAPFEKYKELFEKQYGVEVRLYAAGSRQLAMEIVDLGKRPDIYASADYALIEQLLIPNYTKWYMIFASNEMVIAYTNNSRYSDIINATNWFEILNRSDVFWGHSDPDLDPCGYRTLLVLKLAEIYYNNTEIYDDLKSNSNRVIRPKSVDLLSLLESGELDYAFEYKSVAVQHNLSYVELPKEINLGYWEYKDYYKQANVTLSDGTEIVGAPIAYGITILINASNFDYAVDFIRFLIENRDILENLGQNPIYPVVVNNISVLPPELRDFAREET